MKICKFLHIKYKDGTGWGMYGCSKRIKAMIDRNFELAVLKGLQAERRTDLTFLGITTTIKREKNENRDKE